MHKKKIAFLMNSKIFSGAESVVLTIYEHLKQEYDFVYVTQEGPILEVLKERKVPFFIINKMCKKEIERMIKELEPDCIHAIDFRASLVAASVKKTPYILSHLHNNPLWLSKRYHPFSISYLWASKRCNKIAIVSDAIEKEYVYADKMKEKMVNVGNPIDRATVLQQVEQTNQEKQYDVCFVGRLEEVKNPMEFIGIIKNLKQQGLENIKAVMVGEGSLKEKLQNHIQEEKLKDTIFLVGFQKNPYTYMKKSKVFCLPSRWEGFGLVAFEALTLGIPCVVSNVGGLVHIVDESCGALCNNQEDFVLNIKKLLENQQDYEKVAQNAIAKSKKIENIQRYMSQLDAIYKEI